MEAGGSYPLVSLARNPGSGTLLIGRGEEEQEGGGLKAFSELLDRLVSPLGAASSCA